MYISQPSIIDARSALAASGFSMMKNGGKIRFVSPRQTRPPKLLISYITFS